VEIVVHVPLLYFLEKKVVILRLVSIFYFIFAQNKFYVK